MIKNLKKSLIYPLVFFSLFGCKSLEFVKEDFPKADGYDVFVSIYSGKRPSTEILIGTYCGKKDFFSEFIQAIDWEKDGRTDEFIIYAPKGSKLERFASIQELDKILNAVLEEQNINNQIKK